MPLPGGFHFDRMARAEEFEELVIDNLVSLRPAVDRLEIQTTVHNTVSDHRLRVLFPSGTQTETYLADSPFDVVERPIALRADNHLYRELEVETKPQQSWTALYDGQRGLAVVSAGLYESAICDQADRPLALTLFRATQRTVFTDGQPNGQLHGSMTFRYWLLPLASEPDRTQLGYLGQALAAGLRDVQLQSKDVTLHRQSTSLPPTGSFLRVDGPAILTSARQVEAGLEVRLFNPTGETISTTLDLTGRPDPNTYPHQVQQVNFESQPLGPAEVFEGGIFKTELTPKQIVTLKLT
jgi:alpha-mannosidase/mannosylglycerate hydrolase